MQHFSVFLRTYWLNVYVKYNQKKKITTMTKSFHFLAQLFFFLCIKDTFKDTVKLFCSLSYTGDCPFKFCKFCLTLMLATLAEFTSNLQQSSKLN